MIASRQVLALILRTPLQFDLLKQGGFSDAGKTLANRASPGAYDYAVSDSVIPAGERSAPVRVWVRHSS